MAVNGKQKWRMRTLTAICILVLALPAWSQEAPSNSLNDQPHSAASASSTAEDTNTAEKNLESKQESVSKDNLADKTETIESNALADEDEANDAALTKDPFERWNRAVFAFNDLFDIYFMKPVAKFYNAVMPKPLNTGIHNFFNNLSELSNIANDILQLRFKQMLNDTWRFTLNSTFGLGGFVDMATRMRLPYRQNDFGLTLANWGYQESSYLVLPLLGPSSIRDGMGIAVDYFGFSVYPYIEPESRRLQVLALLFLDRRANLLDLEPVLEEAAIDKYVFMRNAYMQHRQFQLEQLKEKNQDPGEQDNKK